MNRTVSVRLEEWQVAALDSIGDDKWSRSDVLREGVRLVAKEHGDEIPEWVDMEATHDEMVARHRPELRRMHFKQRVFEYARDTLTDDTGGLAQYAPHPDNFEETYGEAIREEVTQEYGDSDLADDYLDHVDEVMEWYRLLHPDVNHGSAEAQAVTLAAHYLRWDKPAMARKVAQSGEGTSDRTTHEILDKARRVSDRSGHIHKWARSAEQTRQTGLPEVQES